MITNTKRQRDELKEREKQTDILTHSKRQLFS